MRNSDLNACGVSEMNVAEMKTVDGGNPIALILAGLAFLYVVNFVVALLD